MPSNATSPPARVYLVGFMGSGKTTVGERLAETLGVPFVDLDRAIEERAGATVGEIFEHRGEPAFRRLEQQALRETLKHERVVVATGGGAMTVAANLELMRGAGITVWLDLALATILERVGSRPEGERPLFGTRAEVEALYRRRLGFYRRADLRVEVEPGEKPGEVAARIGRLLGERTCAI